MTDERLPGKGDWSQYVTDSDQREVLEKQDPALLRIARKIAPEDLKGLLNRLGWQEIPQGELPMGGGELVVSPDESIVGFQPEGIEVGLCGIAISPGETAAIPTSRARIIINEGDTYHRVNVPEGQYQLVLIAPHPWTNLKTQEIVFYTARAMVACTEDPEDETVRGTLTAFGRDRRPIGWMVLNEWSQPGVLQYAYRCLPGIVFPEKLGEAEAPVFRLHSLASERRDEMPGDVIAGSGLVAVQFFENRIDPSGKRSRGLRKRSSSFIFARPWEPETVVMRSMGTLGDEGLTVYEQGTTTAYGVEKGGVSDPIGPTVLLSVTSSPGLEVAPVQLEGVVLKEHRIPTDKFPSLQALARWGFKGAKDLLSESY